MMISPLERQASVKLSLVLLSEDPTISTNLTELLDSLLPGNYELISIPNYSQLEIIQGWQLAQGEILGLIQGDLQPQLLLQLLQEMEKGADLAVITANQLLLSPLGRILSLIILPQVITRLRDPLSNIFLVRREAIATKQIHSKGSHILLEIMAKAEIFRLVEIDNSWQKQPVKIKYLDYFKDLIKLRLELSARFIRFCTVGIAGVVVDMGALFLLSDPQLLNLPVTLSKMIASELGIIHNFLWNDFWTFRDISRQQPGLIAKLKRLLKFNFVCLTGLIISVIVFYILYNYLGFSNFTGGKYVANFISLAVVTFWNFWLHSKLSWRVKK